MLRRIKKQELKLLEHLLKLAQHQMERGWEERLQVEDMADGGMGSLLLYPKGGLEGKRFFGKTLSEYDFVDSDGVVVSTALNLDSEGELFELDIWKTDFNPLISLPESFS